MLQIDHVIIAVADPDAWAVQLDDLSGLTAVPGGRHEGTGTGNWIVPLGGSYVELMTVVDHSEAESSTLGRWVSDQTRNGDRLAALCLRTDDIGGIAARIGDEPEAMSRTTDDGTILRWQLTGLAAAMSDEGLPFYIQWDLDDEEQYPGRMPVEHRVEPSGIRWIEYGGDPQRLAEWLGDHSLPIRSVEDHAGPRRVAIATADGTVHLMPTGIA